MHGVNADFYAVAAPQDVSVDAASISYVRAGEYTSLKEEQITASGKDVLSLSLLTDCSKSLIYQLRPPAFDSIG